MQELIRTGQPPKLGMGGWTPAPYAIDIHLGIVNMIVHQEVNCQHQQHHGPGHKRQETQGGSNRIFSGMKDTAPVAIGSFVFPFIFRLPYPINDQMLQLQASQQDQQCLEHFFTFPLIGVYCTVAVVSTLTSRDFHCARAGDGSSSVWS